MKVLLDENLPHNLRRCLSHHEVVTVRYAGWAGLKNGELLKAAEGDGFDAFVTGDKSMRHQQRVTGRRIAIVFLSANNWPIIKDYQNEIASAVDRAQVGLFERVECGRSGLANEATRKN